MGLLALSYIQKAIQLDTLDGHDIKINVAIRVCRRQIVAAMRKSQDYTFNPNRIQS